MVKNILITAGGTTEKIDDVRVITNFSTGRLGLAVARSFLEQEGSQLEKIYYLCDRNTPVPTEDKVEVVRVMGVQGLLDALETLLMTKKIDAVIHAMAVSDYAVKTVTTIDAIKNGEYELDGECKTDGKISSEIEDLVIILKKTPKVIGEIKKIQPETLLVGFKLLTNVEKELLIDTGFKLLQKNSCDLVLANDLSEISGDKHIGYLISKDGRYEKLLNKKQIADAIVRDIEKLTSEQNAK